jgi:ketosteroid isomerase-like protein
MSEQMQHLAEEWYAAWNEHDLDRIVTHYSDDVVFTSPFVAKLSGDPQGRLVGKAALRQYFAVALERFPDLEFKPIALLTGVDSMVLHYVSVEDKLAAELMVLGEDGLVHKVLAHYD